MTFLNSASSAAALVFYLPGVCTHSDSEGKKRKARARNILKSSEKTQYLMNTLCINMYFSYIFCLFCFRRLQDRAQAMRGVRDQGDLHVRLGVPKGMPSLRRDRVL